MKVIKTAVITLFLIETYCRDIFRFEIAIYNDMDCNIIALIHAWYKYPLYLSKPSISKLIAIGINDQEYKKTTGLSAGLNSIRRHPIRVNSSVVMLAVQCKYLIKLCITTLLLQMDDVDTNFLQHIPHQLYELEL